ncbi:hypothetical protein HWQ46_06580 [Shewanella sp. D64]|uniref:hypothetical protein n=1 Tax=unclassified Shewanella TaxID=196818 RepID=UPI0022BA4FA1|nr:MULTISPECIES: hypothetical protein [unclassified Shewanella]MEC4725217.1 hypothetical protein [Shewanella sp. D64]MEC4735937.1 hypothetical protein [Shewanella sp. E94]WBJ93096.1 hypothetical protein HWQ47_14065 [Shewanella sp. MTB7]
MRFKQIISVEMANTTDILSVSFGQEIEVVSNDGSRVADYWQEVAYLVLLDGKAVDDGRTRSNANEVAQKWQIDDDLRVTGLGTHSNKRYWQLPIELQRKIRKFGSVLPSLAP